MLKGFEEEGYSRGVPMIPKPKSEAWVLCGLKYNDQHCDALEERSGNDDSPNSLKKELREHQGGQLTRSDLIELFQDRTIDVEQTKAPSFLAFRKRLEEVDRGLSFALSERPS